MKPISWTLGLCAILTMLIITSSCMRLNNESQRPDRKTAFAQMESISRHFSNTVTDVSKDIAPVLGAVGSEVFHEVNSDMSAVTAELQSQLNHLSPFKKPHQAKQ